MQTPGFQMSTETLPPPPAPLQNDDDVWEVIVWCDDYCTGHPDIDRDHQRLFSLFNAFSLAMNAGEADELVEVVLEDLADYVRYHFAREEALMLKTDYPGYERHKRMHDIFSAQVADAQAHRTVGGWMSAFLLSFLAHWLTGHILDADQQLGTYLAQHGQVA